MGDQHNVAELYFEIGVAAYYQGDFARAEASFGCQLALCEAMRNPFGRGSALIHLSGVAGCQGDYARAVRLLDETEALDRELGCDPESALALRFRGQVACQQGDWAGARRAYGASVQLWHQGGVHVEVALCLEGLGRVAAGWDDRQRAARVWGAAAALRTQLGAPLFPVDQAWYEAAVAHTRAILGETVFMAAWAEGQAMTLDQAIAWALDGRGYDQDQPGADVGHQARRGNSTAVPKE